MYIYIYLFIYVAHIHLFFLISYIYRQRLLRPLAMNFFTSTPKLRRPGRWLRNNVKSKNNVHHVHVSIIVCQDVKSIQHLFMIPPYLHTYMHAIICVYINRSNFLFLIPATMQQRVVDERTSAKTTNTCSPSSQSPGWEDQPPQYKDIVHTFPVSSRKSSTPPVLSRQPVEEVATTESTMKNTPVS